MRSGFPPPSTLKQVAVLHIDRYSIPPETILSPFQTGCNLHYRQILAKLRIKVYISQFFPLFCTLSVDHRAKKFLYKTYQLRNYWRSKNSADFEDEERYFVLNFKAIRYNFIHFIFLPKRLIQGSKWPISFLRCFRLTETHKN
jgi:hypothetical protein